MNSGVMLFCQFVFSPEDVVLSLLPMFHIYSITIVNLCSLKSGCTLVSLPRFDLDLLLHVANKYKITVAPIVPPIILCRQTVFPLFSFVD